MRFMYSGEGCQCLLQECNSLYIAVRRARVSKVWPMGDLL